MEQAAEAGQEENPDAYWSRRADSLYLQYVFFIARVVGCDAQSVIDVGSNGCPYLEWLDWIPRKVSVDLRRPYAAPGVESVTGDFLSVDVDGDFDLGLCLQVLEHIPEVEAFAQKLLATARHLVVSVPYRWEKSNEDHVHDPVDAVKLAAWFGRKPNYRIVVREPFSRRRRMVAYFDRDNPDRRVTKVDVNIRRPSRLVATPFG